MKFIKRAPQFCFPKTYQSCTPTGYKFTQSSRTDLEVPFLEMHALKLVKTPWYPIEKPSKKRHAWEMTCTQYTVNILKYYLLEKVLKASVSSYYSDFFHKPCH